MKWWKIFLIILAVGFVGSLVFFAIWFTRSPLDLKVEAVEPSLMIDRSVIVTLGLTNPGSGFVQIDTKTLLVEAKAAGGWVPINDVWAGIHTVSPHENTLLLALMPHETQACRVRLNYSPETLKERLATLLRDHAPKLVSNFPVLRNWLWPPGPMGGWVPPPRSWTEAQLEAPLVH